MSATIDCQWLKKYSEYFTLIIVLWEDSIDWFTSLYNSQLIKYEQEENKYFCLFKQ